LGSRLAQENRIYIKSEETRFQTKQKQKFVNLKSANKDGNGAVWVGFRPAPPRPDLFRYPPQKNPSTAPPRLFNGYPFNPPRRVPNLTRFIFFLRIFSTWSSSSSDPTSSNPTRSSIRSTWSSIRFFRSNFFKSNAELNPVNVELN
jgi:hypothetical protein